MSPVIMARVKYSIQRAEKVGSRSGFTLIEILIVIAIIAVLALVAVVGSKGFVEKGRKVQVMAQFRDFEVGLKMYENDYNRPPIPESKRAEGYDTMYGDPGGLYSTSILVVPLAGMKKEDFPDFPDHGTDEVFDEDQMNRRAEKYLEFPLSLDNKNGIGFKEGSKDGRLYDAWGREVIMVINGGQAMGEGSPPITQGVGPEPGKNDTHLETWGFGVYTDTRPGEQSYVFISYGADGKKGKGAKDYWDVVPYSGSDDVISW
jgi:prepilin-type N-terminal cleavage/methylation domain-containing protein